MPSSHPTQAAARASWLGRAPCCLALALLACGSRRLDTAAEPLDVAGANAGSSATAGRGGTANLGGDASFAGTGGSGGAPPPLPTEELVSFADFDTITVIGPVNAEPFQVAGQTFTEAWRATMPDPPTSPLAAQLVMPLNKPVAANQLLSISFWVNCEAPGTGGDCYTEFIFERSSDPWEKSVTFAVHGTAGWAKKTEYFSVVQSYPAGGAHMVFRLGYATQVIAIGGVELQSIGSAP